MLTDYSSKESVGAVSTCHSKVPKNYASYEIKNPSEARWLVCIGVSLADVSGDITSSHGWKLIQFLRTHGRLTW